MNKDKILNTVQQYILKGQTDKAIKELQKLVKATPKDIRSHQKLGDLYLKKGDNEKAIEEYLRLAKLYEEEDLNSKAISIYKRLLSINPKLIEALHKTGELYLKEGLKGDAKSCYQTILKMRPHDQKSLNALKTLEEEQQRPKEVPKKVPPVESITPKYSLPPKKERVEETFELSSPPLPSPRLSSSSPTMDTPELPYETESAPPDKDLEMHYHLGIAYKEMELFDYAISEFEQASSNPTIRFDSYIMLGNCFMEKGVYDKSIEHYKMASRINGLSEKNLARIQYNLGLAYEANGMISEALDSYYLASKSDPSSSEAKEKIKRLQRK
jgi:tetratricopeptide (TPR) repeat protein